MKITRVSIEQKHADTGEYTLISADEPAMISNKLLLAALAEMKKTNAGEATMTFGNVRRLEGVTIILTMRLPRKKRGKS